jgi:hypothetical protein
MKNLNWQVLGKIPSFRILYTVLANDLLLTLIYSIIGMILL